MAVDNRCQTAQTFCSIQGQTAKSQPSLIFNFEGCYSTNETVQDNIWNEIIQQIMKIHNYGIRGTRNPNLLGVTPTLTLNNPKVGHETDSATRVQATDYQSKLKALGSLIDFNSYNEVINAIKPIDNAADIHGLGDHYYGSYYTNIKDILNNYTLNSNRCDNCNVGCNVTCQVWQQCCVSDCCTQCCTTCYDGGGGGGCSGCDCGGERYESDCTTVS